MWTRYVYHLSLISLRLGRSCLTDWRRKLSSLPAASDSLYSGVEQQLDILGADHVGYAQKRFTSSSGAPFAIVGARPFSKVSVVIAQTDGNGA